MGAAAGRGLPVLGTGGRAGRGWRIGAGATSPALDPSGGKNIPGKDRTETKTTRVVPIYLFALKPRS